MNTTRITVGDTQSASATTLRRVLLADGCLAVGFTLLLAVSASPLSDLLGLPTTLLRLVGLGLLPWAAFVLYAATRPTISRPLTLVVASGNAVWTLASLLLLITGWVDPTALGHGFVIAQTLLVAVIAGLQYRGLRYRLTQDRRLDSVAGPHGRV